MFFALLSSSCCAFHVPIQAAAPSSRRSVLIPHVPSTTNGIIVQKLSSSTILHQNTIDKSGVTGMKSPTVEEIAAKLDANNTNAIVRNTLKQALATQQSAVTFFLSLFIFVLPFFLLSPDESWATQSGGRIGGSFEKSRQPSSGKMYSSPPSSSSYSRGYRRGYLSGYYSRPYTRSYYSRYPSPFYPSGVSPLYPGVSPFYR